LIWSRRARLRLTIRASAPLARTWAAAAASSTFTTSPPLAASMKEPAERVPSALVSLSAVACTDVEGAKAERAGAPSRP
jgi:hypothetical protein